MLGHAESGRHGVSFEPHVELGAPRPHLHAVQRRLTNLWLKKVMGRENFMRGAIVDKSSLQNTGGWLQVLRSKNEDR